MQVKTITLDSGERVTLTPVGNGVSLWTETSATWVTENDRRALAALLLDDCGSADRTVPAEWQDYAKQYGAAEAIERAREAGGYESRSGMPGPIQTHVR